MKLLIRNIIFLSGSILFLPIYLMAQSPVPTKQGTDVLSISNDRLWEKGVLNSGNTDRMKAVFTKAEQGKDIVVGAIGGSITMGADINTPVEGRWANRVAQWFKHKFPNTKVHFYNAGIGATNSTFGALRAFSDLLQYKPDIVVFEFSINDSDNDWAEVGAEGLLRQILDSENHPAVIMLAMMNRWGGNVQEKHLPLAQHYDIPFVSFRNIFEPIIKDSTITYNQILADDVHPNSTGHEMAGRLVRLVLENAWLSDREKGMISKSLPKPLYGDKFENVAFFRAPSLRLKSNTGWELIAHKETEAEPWRIYGQRIIERSGTPMYPEVNLVLIIGEHICH